MGEGCLKTAALLLPHVQLVHVGLADVLIILGAVGECFQLKFEAVDVLMVLSKLFLQHGDLVGANANLLLEATNFLLVLPLIGRCCGCGHSQVPYLLLQRLPVLIGLLTYSCQPLPQMRVFFPNSSHLIFYIFQLLS